MPRKTKSQQNETLDAPVRMDGVGEDPAIKALLSDEFVEGSNVSAAEIATALAQIIRGQNFLGSQVAQISERMDKMDADSIKREAEQKKYIDDVFSKAEKLKAVGDEKDKIVAQGAAMYAEALQDARAKGAVNALRFEEILRDMPTETVISPGVIDVELVNGVQTPKLFPEVIRIKHKVWVLQPGVPMEVPMIVAERMREKRRSEEHTERLKEILGKQMNTNEMAKQWNAANRQFDENAEPMPTVPD